MQGVLHFYLSPRDSLVFVSGCLVINRLWSVCLTGGSLGFDSRTLISPENSQNKHRGRNRRISQKRAQPQATSRTFGPFNHIKSLYLYKVALFNNSEAKLPSIWCSLPLLPVGRLCSPSLCVELLVPHETSGIFPNFFACFRFTLFLCHYQRP